MAFTSVVKLLVEAKVEFQVTERRRRVILVFNIFDLECEMRKKPHLNSKTVKGGASTVSGL